MDELFLEQLADAQDAYVAAILLQPEITGSHIPAEVGYPANGPLSDHVWLTGSAAGELAYEISTGGEPSDHAFTIGLNVLVTLAADLPTTRARLVNVVTAARRALSEPSFLTVVSQAQMGRYRVTEGRSDGKRQLHLALDIECVARLG